MHCMIHIQLSVACVYWVKVKVSDNLYGGVENVLLSVWKFWTATLLVQLVRYLTEVTVQVIRFLIYENDLKTPKTARNEGTSSAYYYGLWVEMTATEPKSLQTWKNGVSKLTEGPRSSLQVSCSTEYCTTGPWRKKDCTGLSLDCKTCKTLCKFAICKTSEVENNRIQWLLPYVTVQSCICHDTSTSDTIKEDESLNVYY